MRFFTMEQDRAIQDIIQFRDFDIAGPRHIFYKEDAEDIDTSATLYLAPKTGETAPDYIQFPVHMVSDTVKKVLDMYEDDMVFRTIVLTSKENDTLRVYHHLLLERLDVFSEQTEFYPNGSIKRLVLDAKKIGEHKVFMRDRHHLERSGGGRMAELTDTYVVHGAPATCTMGMRFSYIALHRTYGVFLRLQPQMTVEDCIGNYHVLNFGGCYSMENPDTQREAEKVREAVEEQCPDTFLDSVMGLFCSKKKKKQQEVSEDVPQVVGKCTPIIIGNQEWDNGKDGVKTDGKTPLLGGAKLRCKYGGEIEIVHSGQQEAGG